MRVRVNLLPCKACSVPDCLRAGPGRLGWAGGARAADFGRPTDRELSEEALDLLARIFVADPKQRITLAGIQVAPRAHPRAPHAAREPCMPRMHDVRAQARAPAGPTCAAAAREGPARSRRGPLMSPTQAACRARLDAPGRARSARRPAAPRWPWPPTRCAAQAHAWLTAGEPEPLDLEAVNGPLAARCQAGWAPEDEQAVVGVVAQAAASAMEAMGSGDLNEQARACRPRARPRAHARSAAAPSAAPACMQQWTSSLRLKGA